MSKVEETVEQKWLSLKPMAAESATRPYPTKIFGCRFCDRIFYSSQALGGHQNAHKRERGFIRYFQPKSLGVQPHAHLHKPPARATPVLGSMWPGIYRAVDHRHTPSTSTLEMLDLNLKL